jgi:uncharacterized repeat protein (TIGR02059 family)
MRKAIIILFLSIPFAVNATTYYVATNGSDSNRGTLASPWKTWAKGFATIVAGDTLYIRQGTYTDMQGSGGGNYSGVRVANKSGTSNNPIVVSSYPGDARPILDCSSLSSIQGYHRGILMGNCNYWNIYGLIIKNVREWSGGPTQYTGSAWEISDMSNITIEYCDVTHCMNGFSVSGTNTKINYINCDSYENWDIYQGGDLCNGFNGNSRGSSTITYTGCRAWLNSDDGFDYLGGSGTISNINCWAFNNRPWHGGDEGGNGCGFKLAQDNTTYTGTGVRRTLINCIAANNGLIGIEGRVEAGPPFDMAIYNCTVANNSNDYGIRVPLTATYGTARLKNNISYGSKWGDYSGGAHNITNNNSWNSGIGTASDADFVSADYTQLANPRSTSGSLPIITAFHLVAGSDLIDKGADTGLLFNGKAPDLGAFELQASSTSNTPPVFKSGVVENVTPSLLVMSYDLNLNSLVVPPTSSFKILVNATVRTVNSVLISGNKVELTLASAIKSGDIITASYTKPANNPLQATSGAAANSISVQSIVNHLNTPTPDGTPAKITMTINPNPVHNLINILFAYASTFSKTDPASSPQVIRIMNISGQLFIEKLMETGVTNIKFPINIKSGIYTVMLLSAGENITSQKVIVY